jgi:hypothetical protein
MQVKRFQQIDEVFEPKRIEDRTAALRAKMMKTIEPYLPLIDTALTEFGLDKVATVEDHETYSALSNDRYLGEWKINLTKLGKTNVEEWFEVDLTKEEAKVHGQLQDCIKVKLKKVLGQYGRNTSSISIGHAMFDESGNIFHKKFA